MHSRLVSRLRQSRRREERRQHTNKTGSERGTARAVRAQSKQRRQAIRRLRSQKGRKSVRQGAHCRQQPAGETEQEDTRGARARLEKPAHSEARRHRRGRHDGRRPWPGGRRSERREAERARHSRPQHKASQEATEGVEPRRARRGQGQAAVKRSTRDKRKGLSGRRRSARSVAASVAQRRAQQPHGALRGPQRPGG